MHYCIAALYCIIALLYYCINLRFHSGAEMVDFGRHAGPCQTWGNEDCVVLGLARERVLLYYCIILHYCSIVLLYDCITGSLYYFITLLLYDCISRQSITALLHYCIIVLLYYCLTVLLYHCMIVLLYYRITVLLSYCIVV